MNHSITTSTNKTRRAHPAVIRAALRSRVRFIKQTQNIDPAGNTTDYGYDARGNLISVKDAKGNTHRFDYDKLDRMVKETRPLGQTGSTGSPQALAYSYDANGNLIQVTDPKGQIKKYTYDAANRRTKEQHYPATGSGQVPAAVVKTISYTYNTLGQKTSHTYPDGASYTYSYDTNNQLSTVNLPQGYGSITLNSYLWSVPTQITLPGGTVRNYSYDGLLRLKELDIKDPGQSQVLNTQYGYDTTSNIVSKASSTSSLQASAATTHYSYDTLDHLTGATYSNSSQTGSTGSPQANESYSYDPLANRITGSNASTGSAQGPSNYSYNANNQLTQAGAVSYSYDTNGNTTSQTDSSDPTNTRSYVYDTDNRLIEVHDAANAIIATYRYDPFGRRLSKTLSNTASTGSAQAPAGSSTYYFYSAEGLIAEADANGQIIQSYGYAPGSTFSTNPLWTKLSTAGTATYYTYQNDHLGTPQKLLNQSGLTVWSATYDAFGRATIDPASTITNNLRFPGQYADQETGLHYNWMRFYDPTTGRYVTSDPIGLKGGVNTYAYVRGNSIRWSDSMGLMDCVSAIIRAWTEKHVRPDKSLITSQVTAGIEPTGNPTLGPEPDLRRPQNVPFKPEIDVTFIIYEVQLWKDKEYQVTENWQELLVTCKWKEAGPCGGEIEKMESHKTKKKVYSSEKLLSENFRFSREILWRSPSFGLPVPGIK